MMKTLFAAAVLGLLLVWGAFSFAQEGKQATVLAKANVPNANVPGPVNSPVKKVNADQAYKANCSRCHGAPRKFSDRAMVTIMRHMRVRANMTEEETKAILQYLTE